MGGGVTSELVQSIVASPNPIVALVGNTSSSPISVTVSPDDATNKNYTMVCDNDSVATITTDNYIYGVSKGTTTITITSDDGNASTSIDVIVTDMVVELDNMTLSFVDPTIHVGQTTGTVVTFNPNDATYQSVTYSSDNTSVATVSSTGAVKGEAEGRATIKATSVDNTSITASATITVEPAPIDATGLAVSPRSEVLELGRSVDLLVSFRPDGADPTELNFNSDKPLVASVDDNGTVRALSAGTAVITITSSENPSITSASTTITVLEPDLGYSVDSNGVWLIHNSDGLVAFRDNVSIDGNRTISAKLLGDIALDSSVSWLPIGTDANVYTGTFDGNNFTISGLYIDNSTTGDNIGLFGSTITSTVIQNLKVTGANITTSAPNVGLIARNIGSILNVHISNSRITSTNNVASVVRLGGIVGVSLSGGEIIGCSSTGVTLESATTGTSDIGGLVGYTTATVLSTSYATDITINTAGTANVGGVVGSSSNSPISNIFSDDITSNGTGTPTFGELVGHLQSRDINGGYMIVDSYDETPVAVGSNSGSGTVDTSEVLIQALHTVLLRGNGYLFKEVYYSFKATRSSTTLPPISVVATGGIEIDANSVWQLTTKEELLLFSEIVNAGNSGLNAKLTSSIAFDGEEVWASLADYDGIFDGDNNTISNMIVNSSSDNQGFIGTLGVGGKVQNLSFVSATVTGGANTGVVAGTAEGGMTNVNVQSSSVTGTTNVGGIAGYDSSNTAVNLYVIDTTVTSTSANANIGGMFGEYSKRADDTYAGANVLLISYVDSVTLNAQAGSNIGGLIGYSATGGNANASLVFTSNITYQSTGEPAYAGGIVGRVDGTPNALEAVFMVSNPSVQNGQGNLAFGATDAFTKVENIPALNTEVSGWDDFYALFPSYYKLAVVSDTEVPILAPNVPVAPESIVVSTGVTPNQIEVGSDVSFSATISPSNTTNKIVEFSSSNENVIRFPASLVGNAEARGTGTATITATSVEDSNITATMQVTVVDQIRIESITVNKSNIQLINGTSTSLSITINPPEAADNDIVFTTSDNVDVEYTDATILNPTIVAKQLGTDTITIIAADGSNVRATFTVNVLADPCVDNVPATGYEVVGDVWEIYNADGLVAYANQAEEIVEAVFNPNGGTQVEHTYYTMRSDARLVCDIDMKNRTTIKDGFIYGLSRSTFDGNHKTISNLYKPLLSYYWQANFDQYAPGTTIKNLTIANANIDVSVSHARNIGILSTNVHDMKISGVHIKDSVLNVTGANFIGGMVGQVEDSIIEGSSMDNVSILHDSEAKFLGGLIGRAVSPLIYATTVNNVTSNASISGLIYRLEGSLRLKGYYTFDVDSTNRFDSNTFIRDTTDNIVYDVDGAYRQSLSQMDPFGTYATPFDYSDKNVLGHEGNREEAITGMNNAASGVTQYRVKFENGKVVPYLP